MRFSICLATVACLLAFAGPADAQENWPRFRGAHADGVSPDDQRLPDTWSTTENVAWSAEVPGWGWACPVIQDNRVFLTSVVSEAGGAQPKPGLYLGQGVREPGKGTHRWMVYCFDLNTGEKLWEHEAHKGEPTIPRHPKSTYASETPVTDGKQLYVLFGDVGLYCYDMNGKPLWSKPIEPKKTFFDYGAAASPVVHEDQVFVIYDNLEDSWIAAFDTNTGEENWRTQRDEQRSWATPLVWTNDLRTEIVVPGVKLNRSYDLTGKLLWQFDGKMSGLVIPSPFAAHGMVYLASGYIGDRHRPVYAVRPGAAGDISPGDGEEYSDNEFIEWYQPTASPYNPSPIIYGDYFYTLYDRGFLTCHDARTGEEVYDKQRIGGSYTSSPWAYNGKLFCLGEDGVTVVIQAGPDYELLGKNSLDELSLSTPATAQGKLLIRTASKLYCLTNPDSSGAER